MATNMKFHVLAISIISVVIILLYTVMGPKQADPNATHSIAERSIRIDAASWGISCNADIQAARTTQAAIPLAKDSDGKVIQSEEIKNVAANNALPIVKQTCEGQLTCEVPATDAGLGITIPVPGCYKKLDVNYRCSENDRLVIAHIDQGMSLKIDCTPDASAPEQHKS